MDIKQLYHLFLQHPRVGIDSRKVETDSLFFAIRGERFDGNEFAVAALDAGAAFAVIDRPELAKDERFILVDDTLIALQHLARHHRRQFKIPILAITGSNGKTTTKELVSAVFDSHYTVHHTQGNFNNHIGVPLTLLAMTPGTEVAVVEMGANHQGEIAALCRIAEPTHGLITNIGKAHLEGFGGIEGVKKGKSELYLHLAAHNGVAFVNEDADFLKSLAMPVRKKIFYHRTAAVSPSSDIYSLETRRLKPFVTVAFLNEQHQRLEVNSHLIGRYNVDNIMTAITVGRYFKVPSRKIKRAIEQYIPHNNRSQIYRHGSNTFILDAYNANPSSVREALLQFKGISAPRKVAILGDMLELGTYAEEEHNAAARLALDLVLDEIILVGPTFEPVAQTWQLRHFTNVNKLKEWMSGQHFEDTFFLVKGSRRLQLERVIENN